MTRPLPRPVLDEILDLTDDLPTFTGRPTWDHPDADPLADMRDIAQESWETYPQRWEHERAERQRVEDLAAAMRLRKQPLLSTTVVGWLIALPVLALLVWCLAWFAGSIT